MPTLYVLSGPEIGRRFVLADGAVLGRADDCDAVLRHLSVSRRHARIEKKRAGWRVRDLGSRNGLFEDGQRVKHLFLEDGTEFRLGELELRVRFEDEAAAAEAEDSTTAAPAAGPGATSGGTAAEPAAASDDELLDALAETVQRPVPAPPASEPLEEDFEFEDETPVAPAAPASAAERAELGGADEISLEDPDEISLEGPDEIDLGAQPATPSPADAPRAPGAPRDPGASSAGASSDSRASASPGADSARRAPARPNAAERAGIAPTARAAARDPARKALQYSRIESNGGFLSADLAQYPLWVRLAALAVALVLFAGLFVLAFRTASS